MPARLRASQIGNGDVQRLPLVEAPDTIWAPIEAAFRERRTPESSTVRRWRFAVAAAVLLSVVGAASWCLTHQSGARWAVVRLDGSPVVGETHLREVGQIGAGEWIETDSGPRATITVGEIGSVEVTPNTRVRVVTARPDEHRLALARGEIRAKISAPPRLFFVDTPSGTAVDLGCEYTLNTDEDGFGLLRVTKGWVSFQWKGQESLVPAGASCPTRRRDGRGGPGIPYFDDAPERIKQALASVGFEKGGDEALSIVLTESRARDTLTLWHLLSRVDVRDRGRVYDRMAALTPVPAGVSRDRVLTRRRELFDVATWYRSLRPGDNVDVADAGARRRLHVHDRQPGGIPGLSGKGGGIRVSHRGLRGAGEVPNRRYRRRPRERRAAVGASQVTAMSRPGVYAVYRHWPSEGARVVILKGACAKRKRRGHRPDRTQRLSQGILEVLPAAGH